ncbi:IQCK isoform 14, partial [Pan troglodytes]
AEETSRGQAHSPASQNFLGQARTKSEMQNGGRCSTCSQDENSIILTIAKTMQQSAGGR